ncbi:MAG: adenylate/guanylate cyclase domain-containing protein, partial [Phycisphaerales bacterium]|nr:adenylate/guanylate cyclase domain-containing protein [Phycisphaerales bacterium]
MAAIAGVWGGITLYRQSTEERARRRLHRALTQYTSPAIAAQIAERFDRATLAPQTATVTCFFSDLRGFTRLSERLGPERTRNVLNPYLETVSRILLDRGAMVNKFIGDGIFAFFNAPIRVCSDHARAACEAALASSDALLKLNQRLSSDLGDESLAMRVGVSTGEAFVGDYGSEMKLDYTCIGDTVNLGSRLEQANKVLGTTILVDDRTRQAAGDGFVFRPIGRIAVSGRSTPACVHELVDHPRTADPGFVEFCDLSARAIAYYQACEWDSCLAVLAEGQALRPHDCVLALYARSVETLQRTGRPSHWDGALPIG